MALAEGARQRGAAIRTGTRVLGISVRDGRVREVETTAGSIRTEVVVNAGGMYAPEIGRMVGVTIPLVPMAHQYLVTKPIDGVHPAIPMLRDPDRLVYFREEVGGLVAGRVRARAGAVGARRHPGRLQPPAPAAGLGALRAPDGGRRAPGAGDRERGDRPADQRPRGLHAGRRVHPRRVAGGPGLLRRVRFLRPRHRRRRRHGADHGRLDRRGRSRARRLAHGPPPVRRSVPVPPADPRADARGVPHVLRPSLPEPGARGRAAAPPVPGVSEAPRARGLVRREVGLGAAELVRAERGGRRRGTAPPRLRRADLVSRDRGRASGDARAGGALRRDVLLEAGGGGSGRARPPPASLRQRRRQAGRLGRVHVHAQRAGRHRVRLHGDAAGADPVPDRDRHGVRHARPRLHPAAPAGGRVGHAPRRHRGVVLHRSLGTARTRHPCGDHDGRRVERRLSLPHGPGAGGRAGTGPRGRA